MTLAKADADSRADRALRAMARGVVPVERPERAAEQRARLLPGLNAFAGAVIETRRRRRLWTLSVTAAAVVALLAGAVMRMLNVGEAPPADVFASVRAKQGDVRVSRAGGAPGPIGTAKVDLVAKDRVETADSTAEIDLKSGALVEVDSETRLELGRDVTKGKTREEHLDVAFGKIGVHVPKLPAGSRLIIGTPNAIVTVHGTAFEVVVRKLESGVTSTAVSVTEGRVSVTSEGHEIMLGPGANWASSPVAKTSTPSSDTATPAGSPAAPPGPKPRSTLARENALFRSALAARRAGKPERAVALIDELFTKYPGTPLASAATAERARAESAILRRRSAAAAPE